MLSKNKLKFIRSLEQKKYRRHEGVFIAEGHKSVGDLLFEGFTPVLIIHTSEWMPPVTLPRETETIEVSTEELGKASFLVHPQQVIGVFRLPPDDGHDISTMAHQVPLAPEALAEELILCLDGVQDPGNLGTIIRTADWFGIRHIVCSTQTADAYAPKTVQATMGSIARVKIHYTDLPPFLNKALAENIPVYGTFLDGNNIYQTELQNHGIIIMGNEGNGITPETGKLVTHRLHIPSYSTHGNTAESLNVSIATAIICAEFRRRGL